MDKRRAKSLSEKITKFHCDTFRDESWNGREGRMGREVVADVRVQYREYLLYDRTRVTAGRRVEKVEPGSEKILDVELNFKIRICPAHPRSDVGLEKLRALCEAYAKSIKRDHNKIYIWSLKPRRCICAASTEHKEISMNDESIDAENRANEITD